MNLLRIKYLIFGLAIVAAFGAGLGLMADWAHPALDATERARLKAAGLAHDFVDLPGGVTHFRVDGPADGPFVVLVHGLTTPLFVFDDLAGRLAARGFRVARYDLLGRGLSDRPQGDFDADAADGQLRAFIDKLRPEGKVHLVGYSMGGAVAAIFAARHPERLADLALLAPAGLPMALGPVWTRLPLVADLVIRFAGHGELARLGLEAATDATDPARFAAAYLIDARYRGYPQAVLSSLRHYPLASAGAEYQRIGALGLPVLALWGARDETVPPALSQDLTRLVPQARVETIEGVGHEIPYARPERVAELLEGFWGATGR